MYLNHFQLNQRPFELSIEPEKAIFPGARKEMLEALVFVLLRETGFVKIVGEVGAGKTTLCRWLKLHLRAKGVRVMHLADPTLSPRQVDFALSEELGLPASRDDADGVGARLRGFLANATLAGEKFVLLIDEAQAIPLETLEHVRLLGQSAGEGNNALRLVMVGLPELDRRLAAPAFASLRDRIMHSLRLRRLGVGETTAYIVGRLKIAGHDGRPIFSANAMRLIAGLSRGLPRRINVIADKAMMAAALEGRAEVSSRDVGAAVREIKLDRKRRGEVPAKLLAMVAGGGVAAGVLMTVGVAFLAMKLGWTVLPVTETTAEGETQTAPAVTIIRPGSRVGQAPAPMASPAPSAASFVLDLDTEAPRPGDPGNMR